MSAFTDTRRHDRRALIQRPFTIEEEVTFSEEEDVSVEKAIRRTRSSSSLAHHFLKVEAER
ncbi:hypothetical protein EYF80_040627 [Liparis tanakae]|uniref:Uncharacterized protein n=1 Tax=Liparis tanakae TaxID=230148 RepID=A0A4Z2G8M4_9TELE|nr:hypothetical protein EYF80_040627 [Liparis tanakae]